MEKRRFFALTGAEKSKIARLSIIAAVAIIVVFACIMSFFPLSPASAWKRPTRSSEKQKSAKSKNKESSWNG